MQKTVKNIALVFCLFTFLLIVLGGGLRLNPGGAVLAAATGTPLLIYAFNRSAARPREFTFRDDDIEVPYDHSEPLSAKRLG
jgi:hypothetical protein